MYLLMLCSPKRPSYSTSTLPITKYPCITLPTTPTTNESAPRTQLIRLRHSFATIPAEAH